MTLYPTLEEAIELHDALINRFGGATGLRDPGLLESALYRPRNGYYKTLSMQAAALLQSLARNHPFVDGNKRVAFAMTAIFLRMNGYRLKVSTNEVVSFLIGQIIESNIDLQIIADWIESHSVKI